MSNPVKEFPATYDDEMEMKVADHKHKKEENDVSSSLQQEEDEIGGLEDKLKALNLGKKTFYFSLNRVGSTDQSIYAVDLSMLEISLSLSEISQSIFEVLPVLQFQICDHMPVGTTCVELNSTLYFIGGSIAYDDDDNGEEYLDDSPYVFFVETSKMEEFRKSCEEDPRYLLQHKFVQQAPPMNSPKPYNLYAFVADGNIFVICTRSVYGNEGLYRFEVFDPNEGEEGVWYILPNPPFNCKVTFDLVFSDDKKILLGTFQDGYYLYDCKKKEWFDCSRDLWPTLSNAAPESHCIRGVDDGLVYWNSLNFNVVCYGPTKGVFGKDATVDDLKSLFKDKGSYNERLWRNLHAYAPINPQFTSLHYLGNLTFCYLIRGLPLPRKDLEIPKPVSVHMILFTIPPSDLLDQDDRKFTPNVVHVVKLMCNGEEWMRHKLASIDVDDRTQASAI